VYRLEHLHHTPRRAAVQVVDVNDNPVDAGQFVAGGIAVGGCVTDIPQACGISILEDGAVAARASSVAMLEKSSRMRLIMLNRLR
jgi:hypothetical protein